MKNVSILCVFLLLTACIPLKKLAKLPEILNENSGIIAVKDGIWLLNDSGNEANLYKTDFEGKIVRKLVISNATNIDWEELCADSSGNFYLADIGNNANRRKDLCIYKIENPELHYRESTFAEKIQFYYPEQETFPPLPYELYYDAEAMIALGNSLYIFTKNRSRPNDGYILCYQLPQNPGKDIAAKYINSFRLKQRGFIYSITAAAISPDKKTLVLMAMGKLHIFSEFQSPNFFGSKKVKHHLLPFTQKESISFFNKNTLLISDEKSPLGKARLYKIKIK
jgi:hypothetical protein